MNPATTHRLAWTQGDRMRKAREAARLGSAEMAKAFNVDKKTINNWERDRHEPSTIALREWARLTDVPYEWIVCGAEPSAAAAWLESLNAESGQATSTSPWGPIWIEQRLSVNAAA